MLVNGGVQEVLVEVTLGVTDVLVDQLHRIKLGEKVFEETINMKKAINLGADRLLLSNHQGTLSRTLGKIIDERRSPPRRTSDAGHSKPNPPRAVEIVGKRMRRIAPDKEKHQNTSNISLLDAKRSALYLLGKQIFNAQLMVIRRVNHAYRFNFIQCRRRRRRCC